MSNKWDVETLHELLDRMEKFNWREDHVKLLLTINDMIFESFEAGKEGDK